MEKTPKTKIVGCRYGKQIRENKFNWLDTSPTCGRISQKDVTDLETLPISPDILRTTPVRSESNSGKSRNCPNNCDSPQFQVGWNDGSSKSDFEINSPISMAPIQRRIRRCPDNLMSKLSGRKASLENNCDILQCIDWAKNLIDVSDTEKVDSRNNLDFEVQSELIDSDVMDDSVDELMVLCSQAVEDNIPRLTPVRSKSFDIPHKHHQTLDKNEIDAKRMKSAPMSNNRSKTEENFKFAAPQLIKDSVLREKMLFIPTNQEANQFARKNQKHLSNAVTINKCSNNNSIHISNNCNKTLYNDVPHPSSTIGINENLFKQTSCSKSEYDTINTSTISSRISNLLVSNQDSIKSQLDEDDDIFCSLDLNFVDTLRKSNQSKIFEKSTKSTKSIIATCLPQPVAKYTKEQIEKRRLEAKKRLLFNKRKSAI